MKASPWSLVFIWLHLDCCDVLCYNDVGRFCFVLFLKYEHAHGPPVRWPASCYNVTSLTAGALNALSSALQQHRACKTSCDGQVAFELYTTLWALACVRDYCSSCDAFVPLEFYTGTCFLSVGDFPLRLRRECTHKFCWHLMTTGIQTIATDRSRRKHRHCSAGRGGGMFIEFARYFQCLCFRWNCTNDALWKRSSRTSLVRCCAFQACVLNISQDEHFSVSPIRITFQQLRFVRRA